MSLVNFVSTALGRDTSASIDAALTRKTDRYIDLCGDIEDRGFKCYNIYMPLEMGARGLIDKRNKGLLTHLCSIMKIGKITDITRNGSWFFHNLELSPL